MATNPPGQDIRSRSQLQDNGHREGEKRSRYKIMNDDLAHDHPQEEVIQYQPNCSQKIHIEMLTLKKSAVLNFNLLRAQSFQNKNRVAILAELDKEKRKLLMQNQSSTNHPGASIALSRPPLNKDFRDHAEQQHIAAQQKAALQHAHAHSSGYFITQDSAFGNLILPVLPRLDPE